MVRLLGIASLALAVISSVSGHVIRHRGSPPGWQTDLLQKYPDYHARYLKWKCEDKHNTTFFDTCCHPLLKGEPVSVLDVLNCDSDCEDGSSSVPNPTSYSSAAMTPSPQQYTPTSSPSVPAISHKQDKPASSSPAYTPSPEPSKSVEPSPTPTPASPKSSPTSSPSGGDGSDWHFSGVATYFYQNGNPGSCGIVHGDYDLIAAIDSNTYNKDLCGTNVEIVNLNNNKSVVVSIQDNCPTCVNAESIDLSVGAFLHLDVLATGQIPIKWKYV